MNKVSHLYVLVYPKMCALKIGKADCTISRIKSLKICEVDYKKSYHIEIDKDKVFFLERALHTMFEKYNLSLRGFDGATEMFDICCYDAVSSHIKLLASFCDKDIHMTPIVMPQRKKGIAGVGCISTDMAIYNIVSSNCGVPLSHAQLSELGNISVSTVKRSLVRLVGMGCLEVTNGDRSGHPLRYTAVKPPVVGLPAILSRRENVVARMSVNRVEGTIGLY